MLNIITDNIKDRLKAIEECCVHNKDIENSIKILRRDVNDLHSIIMLREISQYVKKKDRIVFIGTGQINENVVHTYLFLKQAIKEGSLNYDGEILFIARSEQEYNLINRFGFDCKIWRYQIDLALFLLEVKICVLSSHLYSSWGDNLLASCVSGAEKVELWHGLPAKTVGVSAISNKMDFHFFARLVNDCFSVKHICVQSDENVVFSEYKSAFPNAIQYVTGDSRLDVVIREDYRKLFVENKADRTLKNWLDDNVDVKKILYVPTYRETKESTYALYQNIIKILSIDSQDLSLALKLHPGIIFSKEQNLSILDLCRRNKHVFIDSDDEVYSSFSFFDAIITDYSSIRIDFAVTAKPIILWRFDIDDYMSSRVINPIPLFDELDKISIHVLEINNSSDILNALEHDSINNKISRKKFVDEKLNYVSDGQASLRTSKVILSLVNSSFNLDK